MSSFSCTSCGKNIPATAKFCTGCGTKVTAPPPPAASSGSSVQSFKNEYEAECAKNQKLEAALSSEKRMAAELLAELEKLQSEVDQLRATSSAPAPAPISTGISQSDLSAAENRAADAEARARVLEDRVRTLEGELSRAKSDLEAAKRAASAPPPPVSIAVSAPSPSAAEDSGEKENLLRRLESLEELLEESERLRIEAEKRAEEAAAASADGGGGFGVEVSAGGGAPPPPPPPPAGGGGPPPPPPPAGGPPPPPAPVMAARPKDTGRGALLDSINGFSKNKLKKAKTVDKSAPVTKSSPSGGGGAGGAPTNSIAAQAMAARNKLRTSSSPNPSPPKERALGKQLDMRGGLKTPKVDGSRSKSGRMIIPKTAAGPPKQVDFRSKLKARQAGAAGSPPGESS